MIVVSIIALLAAIAVPGFLRARKRSQASRIINDLRLIDSAVDQYAIETNKITGSHRRGRGLDQLSQERNESLRDGSRHPRKFLRPADGRYDSRRAFRFEDCAFGRNRQHFLVALQLGGGKGRAPSRQTAVP